MKTSILTLFVILFGLGINAQVAINEDNSNPDSSAMLDVKSTDKGILVPRMTTTQRTGIASPADGLLVFDSEMGSFWFYSNSQWIELKDAANNHALSDADGDTRIDVEKTANDDTIRFETAGVEYFRMNQGRLGIYNTGQSVFIGEGAGDNDDFTYNQNVFIGYWAGNSNTTGKFNTSIGYRSFRINKTGNHNVSIGPYSLFSNDSASNNTAIGSNSLINNESGEYNTAVGSHSLYNNYTGSGNVGVGYRTNYFNLNGNNNTIIGHEAGGLGPPPFYNNKSGNIFLGYRSGFYEGGNNKLYIENSDSDSANALIYGEFDNDLLSINGKLGIHTQTPSVPLHVTGGSDASLFSGGHLISGSTSGANLVFDENEIMARNNGAISSLYLQDEGGDFTVHNGKADEKERFIIKNEGKTGIGETAPSDKLHINAKAGEYAFRVQVNGNTKFRIYDNGGVSVGFNTLTTYALVLQNSSTPLVGQARAYAWTTYSDNRIKSNQQPIVYGLNEVMQIQPKSYLHHSSEYTEEGLTRLKGDQSEATIGFIAQEVQQIIPEIVYEPENKSEDLWGMDYTKLIPVLTKAIQEQQEIITNLQKQVDELSLKVNN